MPRSESWFGDAEAVRAYRDGMASASRWEAQEHPLRLRAATDAVRWSGEHRAFLIDLHGQAPNVRPDGEPWRNLVAALAHLKASV